MGGVGRGAHPGNLRAARDTGWRRARIDRAWVRADAGVAVPDRPIALEESLRDPWLGYRVRPHRHLRGVARGGLVLKQIGA